MNHTIYELSMQFGQNSHLISVSFINVVDLFFVLLNDENTRYKVLLKNPKKWIWSLTEKQLSSVISRRNVYLWRSNKLPQNTMFSNNNLNDDENFLKEFLKGFYRQIIKMKDYTKYNAILSNWIQDLFDSNEKDPKIFLKLMENHEENENWFSSSIGFFYEYDILCKKVSTKLEYLEDVHVMSHNQYENFNGLEINLCKDEINVIENYFENLDKDSNESQIDNCYPSRYLSEIHENSFILKAEK
ncbi:hypothetical protein C1645_732152 [Glomus cerebriforme]|uniref:Uncharacterized protein n=1 Tax=Glomus cerebriforme TaxID=658196 RepID=A0A397THN4_9GLOM|nr:hypothetical protein C1645_732152 [Glomus cerebriforme]